MSETSAVLTVAGTRYAKDRETQHGVEWRYIDHPRRKVWPLVARMLDEIAELRARVDALEVANKTLDWEKLQAQQRPAQKRPPRRFAFRRPSPSPEAAADET